MKKGIALLSVFAFVLTAGVLFAASKQEAKDLCKKAESFLKQNSQEKLVAEVQKAGGMFDKGEVYVYIFDETATVLAHPKLPTWVGKSFMNLKDADGKYFIKDAMEQLKTKNECWITYKWNNPETKKVGTKQGYFLKANNIVLSCGIWE